MNQPKKFTDLLAGATKPTPANASMETWAQENYERRTAMNQIRERLSPAVMRDVWEALEGAGPWLQELADDGDSAQWVLEKHSEIAAKIRRALTLLDGQEQPNKENNHA